MHTIKTHGAAKRLFVMMLPWLVCGLGGVFYIYEYVLRITPGVISAELMSFFGINALVVSNLAAFYYYAYTPMQLPVGVLLDRFGPRRLLTLACLACAIGTFLFGSTTNLTVACIGRFLVGFGSAFAFVGTLKLATIWLPPNRFALISGLASALGAVGAAVGFVSMQSIMNRISWQDMIFITAVSGVFLAIIMYVVIRDRRYGQHAKDHTIHWCEVLSGFKKVMSSKLIWLNGFIGCLFYLPSSVFAELWGKQYLIAAHGFSADAAAWGVALIFLGFAVGGPIFGLFSDLIRKRRVPMIVGGALAALLFLIMLYVPNLSATAVNLLLFTIGIAYGAQVIVFAVGRELSPGYATATAVAVTNMFVMLSGSFFETMVGWFLKLGWDNSIVNNAPVYSRMDFTYALTIIPVAFIIGIILLLFTKETGNLVFQKGIGDHEQDKVISDDPALFS